MIAITSISPGHSNANKQKVAIKSWIRLGMKVVSFNHPDEVEKLKKAYPMVQFHFTTNTMEHIYRKPYVAISEMINWAKWQPKTEFCFINSDIELENSPYVLNRIKNWMYSAVVVCNRWDWDKTKNHATQYIHGIDAFFLKGDKMGMFGPSLFCMGQCFWDYHIPYTAIKNNVPVIAVQNKFAYHKKHKIQYSADHWAKTGMQFIIEHNLSFDSNNIGRMNEMVFNFLDLNMQKKTL